MVFTLLIGFTQWTSRLTGKNLPKQIWGRKDRGLKSDRRLQKEEILACQVFRRTPLIDRVQVKIIRGHRASGDIKLHPNPIGVLGKDLFRDLPYCAFLLTTHGIQNPTPVSGDNFYHYLNSESFSPIISGAIRRVLQ